MANPGWPLLARKGRFKQSAFEDFSSYLQGEEFNTAQHSIHLWTNPQTGERSLLRLNNMPGGVDEEGISHASDKSLPQGELTISTTVDAPQSEHNQCAHLVWSTNQPNLINDLWF